MELQEINKKYMPVKDYAERHGVSPHVVYGWIKRGKVKGKKIGNYQLVEAEE
jgi:transposase